VVIQRGCELALFQPLKAGNMDCTFCLDCVQACPYDNVGILSRLPASELMMDPRRSGIGFFSRRKDLAALAVIFTFGSLMNVFGMVSPVYAVESWLTRVLHVNHEAPVLGIIFLFFLVVQPTLLLGLAAWVARVWKRTPGALLPEVVRYSYGLVPLGFGIWLAHYGFHFLTGLFTIIPVTQAAFAPLLGEPLWTWTGLAVTTVKPVGLGFLMLGLMGSLLVMHYLAQEDSPDNVARAFAPWATVCFLICAEAAWLILQPMEMRGAFLSA
jgi:hypothetical protein